MAEDNLGTKRRRRRSRGRRKGGNPIASDLRR